MPFDATQLVVAAALLSAAFVKGASGMGFPLIATPAIALLLDIRVAVTILIIPNLIMDGAQMWRRGFPLFVLRRFGGLLVLTVAGVFLGTKVLVSLPLRALNAGLGSMVLLFVLSSWLRFDLTISPRLEKILNPPVGFIAGFLNGMTNAAGPALAIYLYGLKLEKTDFIKSIATIFIMTKLSQLAAVSTWNLFNPSTLRLSLGITLFALLGFYGGLKMQDRINQRHFNKVLLMLLFAVAIGLIARALAPGR